MKGSGARSLNVRWRRPAASGATSSSLCPALLEARLGCGRYRRTRLVNPVNLLADLEEFVHDHHPHGPLTGDATEPAWNGYLLTVACSCGVVFERWVTPERADADLLRLAAQIERAGRIIRPTMRPHAFLSPSESLPLRRLAGR